MRNLTVLDICEKHRNIKGGCSPSSDPAAGPAAETLSKSFSVSAALAAGVLTPGAKPGATSPKSFDEEELVLPLLLLQKRAHPVMAITNTEATTTSVCFCWDGLILAKVDILLWGEG